MSGVFGVLDSTRSSQIEALLAKMGASMSHREGYVLKAYHDERVGLGRIGIGILNKEAQPVVSQDGDTVLFLTGEFFDWEGAAVANQPRRDQAHTDAEYALQMYEMFGVEFAQCLAGAFVIAVYVRSRRTLMLVTDRFGLYPLYFEHQDGYLAFAPEVKAILQVSQTSHQLDDVALAQYMRFQQLLGTRTFFRGIQMLAPASVLTFELETGSLRVDAYWSFDRIADQPASVTFHDAVDEASRLMRLAVARRLRGNHRIGIYLSAGLDSRVILAAYPRDLPRPITLTFGLRSCQDSHYAARVARRAGAPHFCSEFSDGQWVKDYADLHLKLTEGFHAWIHMHGISTLDMARNLFDINLTGFAGDHGLGGPSSSTVSLGQAPDELAYLMRLFELFNQVYHWPGISEADESVLYTSQTHARLAGLAFESLRQELQPYLRYRCDRRTDYFNLVHLHLRYYYHYVTFARSCLDVRHPYCDYDLVDFVLGLPVSFRVERRLEIAALNRLDRPLGMIPTDEVLPYLPTESASIRNAHMLLQRAMRRFNKHVHPLFPERFTLHSDYERWLRDDLRGWAEAILFDRRTLGRGIFSPDFLRSLWAQLQQGQRGPWLGKIAPIMSYEMMLRELYD